MSEERNDLRRTLVSLFYLVSYLFPLAAGLLISPTGTFHLLGSEAEHATTAWRLFGGLLLVLAMVVLRLIRKRRSADRARVRGGVDAYRARTRPSRVDCRTTESNSQ